MVYFMMYGFQRSHIYLKYVFSYYNFCVLFLYGKIKSNVTFTIFSIQFLNKTYVVSCYWFQCEPITNVTFFIHQ